MHSEMYLGRNKRNQMCRNLYLITHILRKNTGTKTHKLSLKHRKIYIYTYTNTHINKLTHLPIHT